MAGVAGIIQVAGMVEVGIILVAGVAAIILATDVQVATGQLRETSVGGAGVTPGVAEEGGAADLQNRGEAMRA